MQKEYTKVASCTFTDTIVFLNEIKLSGFQCEQLIRRLKDKSPFRYQSEFHPIAVCAATRSGYYINIVGNVCMDLGERIMLNHRLEVTVNVRQSFHLGKWCINQMYWDLSKDGYLYYSLKGSRVPYIDLKELFSMPN